MPPPSGPRAPFTRPARLPYHIALHPRGEAMSTMSTSPARTVGILFGMERTFPPALAAEIDRRGGGKVGARLVKVGPVRQDKTEGYDVILDRISHEVPFYRSWLKAEATHGTQV